MRFIDTHCHLNDLGRLPNTADEIEAARDVGVDRIIVVGINLAWSELALQIAEQHQGVSAVIGWHPTDVKGFNKHDLAWLRQNLSHPKCVALGEIGYDFYWDKTTKEEQDFALMAQLDLAQEVGCPIVFHCRDAYDALLEVLEKRGPGQYLLHCFAGTLDQAKRAIALGASLGVDGPVTYKKAEDLREIVRQTGLGHWVLETDAPWLTPEPYRGKPNHPSFIPHIAQGVASALGCSLDEVARVTTENAERFFRLSS
ncbi:MAG: TatD family hydrolase [Fimbriimonadaceae bacterium]|jgi:TatD DNase family protein|nr:TatD family hydrolase [Fimbriimonadaceae bacterium]